MEIFKVIRINLIIFREKFNGRFHFYLWHLVQKVIHRTQKSNRLLLRHFSTHFVSFFQFTIKIMQTKLWLVAVKHSTIYFLKTRKLFKVQFLLFGYRRCFVNFYEIEQFLWNSNTFSKYQWSSSTVRDVSLFMNLLNVTSFFYNKFDQIQRVIIFAQEYQHFANNRTARAKAITWPEF